MKFFTLPVAALLLSASCLTPAFADNYGTDNATANSTTAYNDVNTSSGDYNHYDWNPFTANEGAYFSAQAGGSFPTENSLDDGGSYAAALGYQFSPMVRAELEGAYRDNDFNGTSADANTYTAMINAFVDFKNNTRFTPYVGGGIGWAFQDLDGLAGAGGDDEDNAFVYQVGGGASYNLNQNWALTADYRWVDTADFDYGTSGGDDYSAHEVRGGLRYTF